MWGFFVLPGDETAKNEKIFKKNLKNRKEGDNFAVTSCYTDLNEQGKEVARMSEKNPYATQADGNIKPVNNVAANDPKADTVRGGDLRSKGGSR